LINGVQYCRADVAQFIANSMLALALTSLMFPFIYFGKAERKRTAAKYRYYAANATMTH
jgi:hypothetical protein